MTMNTPWYKQFWPWFLIALPASVVLGSAFTFFLFAQNQVFLVAEDYYKEGKAINQDLSRRRKANELSISAHFFSHENIAYLALNKGKLTDYPEINITLQHRTLPERDIEQRINPDANGRYHVQLTETLIGPWYVEVNAFDQSWAVNGRINFPIFEPFSLLGAPPKSAAL